MEKTLIKKRPHAIYSKGESRTQQQFAEQADIKNIVEKIRRGILPIGQTREPQFLDQFAIKPYHEALNLVTSTNQTFANLPAKIRQRFSNNPARMIEFCSDPKNMDEAIKMGIAKPIIKAKETVKPTPEPKATPAPAEPASGGSKT